MPLFAEQKFGKALCEGRNFRETFDHRLQVANLVVSSASDSNVIKICPLYLSLLESEICPENAPSLPRPGSGPDGAVPGNTGGCDPAQPVRQFGHRFDKKQFRFDIVLEFFF